MADRSWRQMANACDTSQYGVGWQTGIENSLSPCQHLSWVGFPTMPSDLPDGASYCPSGNMGRAAGLTEDESSRSLM